MSRIKQAKTTLATCCKAKTTKHVLKGLKMSSNDVSQLTAMGFPEASAREALVMSNGNLETAINILLGAVEPIATSHASPSESIDANAGDIIIGSISQYSVENGRSACTCIALTAATKFLKTPTVNPPFLQEMIHKGVENYKSLSSVSNVEHLSAEEVLQKDQGKLFPVKSLRGGVRQGILSNDSAHPLGLGSILQGIRQEQTQEWTAILITKTPETVLVCFPPNMVSPSTYWLIDSHPRGHLGLESAYAKPHNSIESLTRSLEDIFPCTDLGPDVPEMMAMMYNSFDLYPLKIP